MARSLVKLNGLRKMIAKAYWLYYVKFLGMHLHNTCGFSLSARFDKYYPAGVHVGANSYVAAEAIILTHDITRGMVADTVIGQNCFIGMRAIIMPGITIHDGCVVGAGSVVTNDIPPASLAAGNPAKVLRRNEEVGRFGQSLRIQELELLRRSEVGIG